MTSQHAPSFRTYLVFGDLHGRILPAFKLAILWGRAHDRRVDGILQVGDLGFFPDLSRLDKATVRHAKEDPSELGAHDIIVPNPLADEIFNDPDCPEALWFTAGNHEDFDALVSLSHASGRQPDFVVDAYCKVRCIKDGRVIPLTEGPKVGALWGVDGEKPNRRQNLPERAYIQSRSAERLALEPMEVLLTHDSPADAMRVGCGSDIVSQLIESTRPAFAFFGHYHGDGSRVAGDFGPTQVYHMSGMEMHGRDGCVEPGSVGALTWSDEGTNFEFLDEDWLRTITRHNWKWR